MVQICVAGKPGCTAHLAPLLPLLHTLLWSALPCPPSVGRPPNTPLIQVSPMGVETATSIVQTASEFGEVDTIMSTPMMAAVVTLPFSVAASLGGSMASTPVPESPIRVASNVSDCRIVQGMVPSISLLNTSAAATEVAVAAQPISEPADVTKTPTDERTSLVDSVRAREAFLLLAFACFRAPRRLSCVLSPAISRWLPPSSTRAHPLPTQQHAPSFFSRPFPNDPPRSSVDGSLGRLGATVCTHRWHYSRGHATSSARRAWS